MTSQLKDIDPSEFPKLDIISIEPNYYDGVCFTLGETKFLVFGKKQNGIGIERFLKAIKLTWPIWFSFFSIKTPPITIVETDWGLGGGSYFLFAWNYRPKE